MDLDRAETERQIREKLEASGQFGKMRAMVVDAALQVLTDGEDTSQVFAPKETLSALKASADGTLALSIVSQFLEYLGLQYTANVFKMESGLTDVLDAADITRRLPVAAGSTVALLPLLHGGRAAPPSSLAVGSEQWGDRVPVPQPAVPQTILPMTAAQTSFGGGGRDGDASGSKAPVETKADPPQPDGEDTTYYISKWRGRTFVRLNEVSGQQVQVEYLTDCQVVILDPLDSMTVDDCEGGEIIIAACEGSVFLRNCKNMTVHVACKQLRTRDCENIDLHIFTTTDPVVEMSHHMSFRPFHLRLPNLRKSFQDCRLDPKQNRFVHVYDFTVEAPGLPQPHYTVCFPEHGVTMMDRCREQGTPECPSEIEELVALRLMPAASSESGENKSYDIKTGAKAWADAAGGTGSEVKGDSDDGNNSSASEGSTSASSKDLAPAVVPSLGKRPPVAPVSTTSSKPATGGLDDQEYSSFDDSEESDNSNDKYDVDEDDDDF